MTWLASIQQVNDDGGIGPLPGEHDVIEITAETPSDLAPKIERVLWRFMDVRDFDLTITNQELPLPDDGPPPHYRVHPNADEHRSRGITAL